MHNASTANCYHLPPYRGTRRTRGTPPAALASTPNPRNPHPTSNRAEQGQSPPPPALADSFHTTHPRNPAPDKLASWQAPPCNAAKRPTLAYPAGKPSACCARLHPAPALAVFSSPYPGVNQETTYCTRGTRTTNPRRMPPNPPPHSAITPQHLFTPTPSLLLPRGKPPPTLQRSPLCYPPPPVSW